MKPLEISNKLNKLAGLDVFEETRKREVVGVRTLLCFLLRNKLKMRWTNIALFFNNQGKQMTHATAIHSCKIYPNYKKNNKKLIELENSFSWKSDLTHDEIDKIHYLENKVKNLEEKLKTANDTKNITTQTKS